MSKASKKLGEELKPDVFVASSKEAIEIASKLIREIGYEPVLVGGQDKGKYLMPGTPLSGEHSPDEVRKIAATLT